MRLLQPYSAQLFALFRIVVGFLFACHGAQKLFGVLGGKAMPLASQLGAAGIIEFFGGILIAIGLFAAPAAFIASGEMAVAYFQQHLPRGFWPIQNGGEMAVFYCFCFLYISSIGSGAWSVDAMRRKGGSARRSRPALS
jgi:putative oxidoreductase